MMSTNVHNPRRAAVEKAVRAAQDKRLWDEAHITAQRVIRRFVAERAEEIAAETGCEAEVALDRARFEYDHNLIGRAA